MRLLYTEKDLLLSACPARQSVPLTACLVRSSVTGVFTRGGNALSKHTLHTKFVLCASSRELRLKPLSSTWPSPSIHKRVEKLESVLALHCRTVCRDSGSCRLLSVTGHRHQALVATSALKSPVVLEQVSKATPGPVVGTAHCGSQSHGVFSISGRWSCSEGSSLKRKVKENRVLIFFFRQTASPCNTERRKQPIGSLVYLSGKKNCI